MVDKTVGSVSVRVRPDTKTFAKELESQATRDVKRVEKRLPKLKVKAELDSRSLKSEALKSLRELNAELKTNDNYKVQFRATISKVGMQKAVREAHKALQELAGDTTPIVFTGDLDAKATGNAVREAIDKVADETEKDRKLSLAVDFQDLGSIKAGVGKVNQMLSDLRSVELEFEMNEVSLNRLKAELEEELWVELNYDAGTEDGLRRAINQIDAELAKLRVVKLKVEPDEESLNEMRDKLTEQLQKRARLNLSLDKGDVASVEAAIRELDKKLTEQASVNIEVGMDKASLRRARAEMEKIRANLEYSAKAAETFQASLHGVGSTLTRFSGLRLVTGMFRELGQMFRNLDQMVPLIGSITLAALGLAGAALSASGSIFSLSRALAQIGPGALALPGIFGGIAIGLGATVAVFKDFNTQIPTATQRLGQIQDSMSSQFWERARTPISDLIDTLLPKFARGLDATARSLGTFFSNLANGLSRDLGGDAITNMFADLNTSIREMATHTGSISKLIRIFGEAGAGRLPELAAWVGTLTDRFANFMAQAEKTGALDRWIDTAITRIQDLGRVLGNTGKLLSGLARAADNATPGDAMSSLADGLDRAQKVVNGSAFQRELTNTLTAAHEMMSRISDKAGPNFIKFWEQSAKTLQTTLPRAGDALGTLFDGIYEMLGSSQVQTGFTKMVDGIARGVEKFRPAFEVLAEKTGAVMELIGQMVDTFGGVFANVLIAITPMVTGLVKGLELFVAVIGKIPAPLIQFAAQMGVLAVAMGKLKLLFTAAPAMFATFATGATRAATATKGVATGMQQMATQNRLLAGVGGIAALGMGMSQAADQGVTFGSVLTNMVGGAMTGLAFGGPIPALIGAAAGGGLTALAAAFGGAKDAGVNMGEAFGNLGGSIQAQQTSITNLKGSLDQLTGAYTSATRAAAFRELQDKGAIANAKELGLSRNTLIDATLGEAGAIRQVEAATAAQIRQSVSYNQWGVPTVTTAYKQTEAQKNLAAALGIVTTNTEAARRSQIEESIAVNGLNKVLGLTNKEFRNWPKNLRTRLETNFPESLGDVQKLARESEGLTKKQLKLILKTAGVDVTSKQFRDLIRTANGGQDALDGLGKSGKQLPGKMPKQSGLEPFWKDFRSKLNTVEQGASKGGKGAAEKLEKPVRGAKANLSTFNRTLNGQIQSAMGTASSGGNGIGVNLGQGVAAGARSTIEAVAGAAAAVVNAAIAAARNAGDIHSPSRKMRDQVGYWLGRGVVVGFKKGTKGLYAQSKSVVKMLKNGLTGNEAKAVTKRYNKLLSFIPKGMDKKERKALQKSLTRQRGHMTKLMGQWNSVVGKIRAKIQAVHQAANQARTTLIEATQAMADPTAIQLDEGITLRFEHILKQQQTAIDKAKRFAKALKEIERLGLNQTQFAQIVAAGPESGLAAAEAIAAAGKAGVKQLNKNQKELNKYAKQAGDVARKQYIEHGMNVAEGFLKGMRAKRKDIEKEMKGVANSMVKTIKKALGIHSPSRVFRDLGGWTGKGFVLGIRDTKRDAESAVKALSTVRPGLINTAATAGAGPVSNRTINYYAAAGAGSLSGEEALFAAMTRARSAG